MYTVAYNWGGAKGALPPPEAPRGWQCPPLGNLDLE